MTATFLPVRLAGGSGTIQPSSQPLSMIEYSIFLIVTGGFVIPSTQEPSHGAGQERPVYGDFHRACGHEIHPNF